MTSALRSAMEFRHQDALGKPSGPEKLADGTYRVVLDAAALGTACGRAAVVFPVLVSLEDGTVACVAEYLLDATVYLPKGALCRWRGPTTNSVRIACRDGRAVVLAAGVARRLSFENLVFTGCGVALEAGCTDGAQFLSCNFVGVRQDFAIRGALDGQSVSLDAWNGL